MINAFDIYSHYETQKNIMILNKDEYGRVGFVGADGDLEDGGYTSSDEMCVAFGFNVNEDSDQQFVLTRVDTQSTVDRLPFTTTDQSTLPDALMKIDWITYLSNTIISESSPLHNRMELILDMVPDVNVAIDYEILVGYHKLIGVELDENRAVNILKLQKNVGRLPTIIRAINRFGNHPDDIINLIYRLYESPQVKCKCIPFYPVNKTDNRYVVNFRRSPNELISAPLTDFYETEVSFTMNAEQVGSVKYGEIWNNYQINDKITGAIDRADMSVRDTRDLQSMAREYSSIPIIIGQDIKGRQNYLVNIIDKNTTEYTIPVLVGIKWACVNDVVKHAWPWETAGNTYEPTIYRTNT